jgi:hypothetical protein
MCSKIDLLVTLENVSVMLVTGQSASSIVILIDSEQNMAEARSISKSPMVWCSVDIAIFSYAALKSSF